MTMRMDPDADMNSRGGFGQPPSPPASTQSGGIGPRRHRTVLVLHVVFRFSVEHAKQDLLSVNRALGRIKRHPVLHGDRQCGWVLETHFTSGQVMDLVRPALTDGPVANAWCWTPGADISSMMNPDPLADRVLEAWRNVRDWNARLGRLPASIFAFSRPIAGGEISTRILDSHPLNGSQRAA